MKRYLVAAVAFCACACSDFSLEERGDLGEACFDNGTCQEPFVCVDGTCIAISGDTDLAFPDDGAADYATEASDQVETPDQTDPIGQPDDAIFPDDGTVPSDADTAIPDIDTLPANTCNEGEICWSVIDTRQTACYNLTGSVACPQEGSQFYGQDGNYSGGGREFLNRTTSGPMLVEDNQTKLWWQKTLDLTKRNWNEANDYCAWLAASNYGDRTDWRLPTRQELLSLLSFDAQSAEALIDKFYFPSTPADTFWTGTKHGYNYYYVDFSGEGMSYSDPAEKLHLVRCVSSPWNYVPERPLVRWLETTSGSDPVVEDLLTGLVWARAIAQANLLWKDALSFCASLSWGDRTDWRLPDINELESLITYGAAPEHTSTFPDLTDDYFWSSTTNAKDIAGAWTVEFRYGIVRPDMKKDENINGIRTVCVRNRD